MNRYGKKILVGTILTAYLSACAPQATQNPDPALTAQAAETQTAFAPTAVEITVVAQTREAIQTFEAIPIKFLSEDEVLSIPLELGRTVEDKYDWVKKDPRNMFLRDKEVIYHAFGISTPAKIESEPYKNSIFFTADSELEDRHALILLKPVNVNGLIQHVPVWLERIIDPVSGLVGYGIAHDPLDPSKLLHDPERIWSTGMTLDEIRNATEAERAARGVTFYSEDNPTGYLILPSEYPDINVDIIYESASELTPQEEKIELEKLDKYWVETLGYEKNGTKYHESLETTGKSKTTSVEATCIRYGHTIVCTDDVFINKELSYQDGTKKPAGYMIVPDRNVEGSLEKVSRMGALVHAKNLGINTEDPSWYGKFIQYLNSHPGESYLLEATRIVDTKGTTLIVTLGNVDPQKPVKVVYLEPILKDSRVTTRNLSGRSQRTPYDFWIGYWAEFVNIQVTEEGEMVVYYAQVSPGDFIYGSRNRSAVYDTPFLVAADRTIRSSTMPIGPSSVSDSWYSNFVNNLEEWRSFLGWALK